MAKSQKRSNREIKKPKADKKTVAAAPAGSVPAAMAKPKSGAGGAPKKG